MAAQCEDETRTGKNMVQGFTPTGHPIMYFFPSRNSLPVEKRRAVNAVFLVERSMDLMTDGVTSVSVVFNFGGKRQGPPASVSMAHKTLHIMSEYYPETLGLAILQDMPWVVRAFVNLMWPFVDSHTKSKIKFASGKQTFQDAGISEDVLLTECGGKMALKYDHETYWPTLIQRCKECREEHLQRWRALGPAQAGREEREFKHAPKTPTVALTAPLTPVTKEAIVNGVDVRKQDVI
ncbi:hypothetical protein VHUM_01655 [Vanrija humicola]|uniref:CRAL-TRIO domain-containing protein n=1 Tax=Vanrija humicola TaxID=5417 RepID=A0A7D8ZQX2_VANHU|nr:hypothetical protein VHUM_01655 [Vanrija humicola]